MYTDISIKRGRIVVIQIMISQFQSWLVILSSLVSNEGVQTVLLVSLMVGSIITYGFLRSHFTKSRRRLEFANLSILLLISYAIACMTQFNQSEIMSFNMGYGFLGLLGVLILINLIYISQLLLSTY
jgi:hypothetical protein